MDEFTIDGRRLTEGKAKIIEPMQAIRSTSGGIPVYSEMTVRKATREGYKISILVYRAIRTIVQAASGIPWIVQDKDGAPIEDHDFTKSWARPNKEFSGQDNMEFLISHLLLCGNSLIQPVMVGGKPVEFWIAMPDLVAPVPSAKPGEWLERWDVYIQGGGTKPLPPDQFIHFQMIDPGNPYWGISPLMAAAKTVDTDNEAQDTQKVSMQNRGVTDGVFTHEAVMSPDQFEEARRQVRENYLAKSRRREPWVLGAGAKWNQMSLTPIEMDYIASRLANLRAVASAFGLDPWWLGDRSASTYNNVQEARKALYEDVVIPILEDIKSTLNLKVAPMYGEGIEITYDVSKIPALREDFGKKIEQAKSLWAMGIPFDQINDVLNLGFDEFPGWDKGYLPMNLIPVGEGGDLESPDTENPPVDEEPAAEEEPVVEEEPEEEDIDLEGESDKPRIEAKGGEGSGNYGHAGRPGEVGGSGEGGATSGLSERALRAKATYKVSSKAIQRQAENNEPKLAKAIGGKQTEDNEAFDVIKGEHAIEVKTIVRGSNNKITMHPESLNRKVSEAKKNGWKPHTVVFDDRSGFIYYKEGVGSYRLEGMTKVTIGDLRGMF